MLPKISFEEYENFYHKYGKTIDQMNIPNKSLNSRQLESKYKKYLKKLEKQEEAIERQREKMLQKKYIVDEMWENIKSGVNKRDKVCQLYYKLSLEEKEIIKQKTGNFLLNKLDCAHIFGRGEFPHLKYDIDNVVLLSRLFHSRLDHFYNPINGESISRDEKKDWWIRIVGRDRYNRLLVKARNKNEE